LKTVFFDLDGTLTDPGEGITNSVIYALQHYGIEVSDRSTLYPFIGPPLTESFIKYFGFSKEQSSEAVEIYREYFSVTGLFENNPYDGIPEMLKTLSESGKTLVVASSKPEIFVRKILDHFDLTKYFLFAAGSELNHTRVDKHEVIEYAMASCNLSDRSDIIMVGDRHHDIQGAKKSALLSVGVTYGYGSREELTEAGADYVVDSVAELSDLLLSL
jgi:phosphoglycolate phosphatase